MASLRRLAFLAFVILLSLYLGLEYAGLRINVRFPYLTKSSTTSLSSAPSSGGYNSAPAHVERISLCAVSRDEDLSAQSQNQTVLTTNLLLTCPGLAEATRGSPKNASFTWQLHNYLKSQLQKPDDKRLAWVFFLKNRNLLFAHSPRSLKKFLPPPSTKIGAISLGNSHALQALGLFAIRVDQWSVDLLKSSLQLLEERPGLTEGEALALALPGSNNAERVAHVPQWWLDVGSSCVEESTWEAQFGISYVAETDQLCCVDSPCRDAIGQPAEKARVEDTQRAGLQQALNGDPGASVERAIQDFWKSGQDALGV